MDVLAWDYGHIWNILLAEAADTQKSQRGQALTKTWILNVFLHPHTGPLAEDDRFY